MLIFEEKGKPEYLEKNVSEQRRKPAANSTHKIASSPGFEPRPHWWEASALTTAPSNAPLYGYHETQKTIDTTNAVTF